MHHVDLSRAPGLPDGARTPDRTACHSRTPAAAARPCSRSRADHGAAADDDDDDDASNQSSACSCDPRGRGTTTTGCSSPPTRESPQLCVDSVTTTEASRRRQTRGHSERVSGPKSEGLVRRRSPWHTHTHTYTETGHQTCGRGQAFQEIPFVARVGHGTTGTADHGTGAVSVLMQTTAPAMADPSLFFGQPTAD